MCFVNDVVAVIKGPDKDLTLPKSYRPVSLLPTLAKALERIICKRIEAETAPNVSSH